MIGVVVLAGYSSVRAGLRAMVEQADGMAVVGESLEGDLRPYDVLLVDLAGDDEPPAEMAVVALVEGKAAVRRLSARSAPWAALPKDADEEEILAALRAVAAGLIALHPTLWPGGLSPAAEGEPLTPREREVLQLMADGLPNKTIASRMGVSLHTVKFHAASIFAKLGATSRTEAVTLGLRGGQISV